MNFYEALSLIFLVIAAVLLPSLYLMKSVLEYMRKESERKSSRHLVRENSLHAMIIQESKRVQTLMNILLSKDLPAMIGLQSQTVSPESHATSQMPSDYIPRDDVSEYMRAVGGQNQMANFLAQAGIGEALFSPHTDPEFNQVMGDLGVDELSFAEDGG